MCKHAHAHTTREVRCGSHRACHDGSTKAPRRAGTAIRRVCFKTRVRARRSRGPPPPTPLLARCRTSFSSARVRISSASAATNELRLADGGTCWRVPRRRGAGQQQCSSDTPRHNRVVEALLLAVAAPSTALSSTGVPRSLASARRISPLVGLRSRQAKPLQPRATVRCERCGGVRRKTRGRRCRARSGAARHRRSTSRRARCAASGPA